MRIDKKLKEMIADIPTHKSSASGIPEGFDFKWEKINAQIFVQGHELVVYPKTGGVIYCDLDWADYDEAPFSD